MDNGWEVFPGRSYPLGATWDGGGVNFALFSEHAERVELCLFENGHSDAESARIELKEQTGHVWHGYLPRARPGLFYGYRVAGPFDPEHGHRFNHHKLLLDPYARATTAALTWSDAMYGYPLNGGKDADLQLSEDDSAPGMPKALVIEPAFSWGDDRRPNTPWADTVIYETHVKGFTNLNKALPRAVRGTYAGLGQPTTIDYLRGLGITAIELMPVHDYIDDRSLVDRGLRNYWGYNSIGFFAPDSRYSSTRTPGAAVNEFKTMVRALHRAGIEVILDVVYNHTAEGNELGPTLSFRGIDNASYYRLMPGNERFYMDYTGTGNTLNMRHPRCVQMIMDSLRYWAEEMHVDGFRFDLAAALARELHEVDRLSAFFDIIQQDPVLSQVKLIAEPWDVGEGGYQVGNFPVLWTEWNGKYRDNVRRFWKGDEGQVGELGYRLTGSSDLYEHNGRKPHASINYVTAHDGFTLRDLVSYDERHNEANGEGNRDGMQGNNSWNCGAEGETDDPEILELRARQQRNFLLTLMVSQGVPMILHGDELGRTQKGNNNAYCQDNEISWLHWEIGPVQRDLLAWTRRVLRFRKEHPILRRRRYFYGRTIRGQRLPDIAWFRPDGKEMTEQDWHNPGTRALTMWLDGAPVGLTDGADVPIVDDTLAFLFNAWHQPLQFRLPAAGNGRWSVALDTSDPSVGVARAAAAARSSVGTVEATSGGPGGPVTDLRPIRGRLVDVGPRSIVVLSHPTKPR